MRNPRRGLRTRIEAARILMPFCHQKLPICLNAEVAFEFRPDGAAAHERILERLAKIAERIAEEKQDGEDAARPSPP
jgi:hypothetical protein